MSKIVAIIQARMGSTRLPGKVLKPILGKPLLERMLERVKRACSLDQIVVATSTKTADDPIIKLTNSLGISFFRGSEKDVLDRYYQTAKKYRADIIVRLTADCPLIDPSHIDQAVKLLKSEDSDYVSNRSLKQIIPSGFDVEVFALSALKKTHQQAKTSYEREHVTAYIYNHPQLFKLKHVSSRMYGLSPSIHLSVDNKKDLKKVCSIYAKLYLKKPSFTTKDIAHVII